MKFSIVVILALMIAGCNRSPAGLSKRQLLTLPEKELRTMILVKMPIGTSKEKVEQSISEEFKRPFQTITYEAADYMDRAYGFATKAQETDFVVKSNLATKADWNNFFLTGDVVTGIWLFDASGKLKDIRIKKWSDGL